MADLYNLTQLKEASTFDKLISFGNAASNGILVGSFVMAIFFVLFMALRRYGVPDALLTSSFISFVLSLIMFFVGWVGLMFPLAFLAITAFTGLYVAVFNK